MHSHTRPVTAPTDEAISGFPALSSSDSCSLWNLLCSARLLNAAKERRLRLVLAEFVQYECLHKGRSRPTDPDTEIMKRLTAELEEGAHMSTAALSLDELREVARLRDVRRLGLGEIAAMVLARKVRGGLVTDDRSARKLTSEEYPEVPVRTISHLVGWLVYVRAIGDTDVPLVIADNKRARGEHGHIGNYIDACYRHALLLLLKERLA